jgi:hypothetical protein
MNRIIRVVSQAVVVLLLLASTPAMAWERYGWHHHYYYRPRVVIGVGPWWGAPYAPWGYYPPPYVAAYPPPVVVQSQPQPQPPVYVEREDASPPQDPEQAGPAPQEAGAYWYYCPGAREYYPKVGTCSEQWVRVPASAE